MKKFLKAFSVIMVIAMLATTLFACGDTKTDDPAVKGVKVSKLSLLRKNMHSVLTKLSPNFLHRLMHLLQKSKVTVHSTKSATSISVTVNLPQLNPRQQ